MEFDRKYIILLGLFLIFAATYVWFSWDLNKRDENIKRKSKNRPEDTFDTEPAQNIRNFQLIETTESGEQWILRSPEAKRYGDTVNLNSPQVRYVTKSETRASITAGSGVYQLKKKNLSLKSKVVIRRLNRDQSLKTESLHWNLSEDTLKTKNSVRMISPRGTLRARGMKANLRKEKLSFLSSVRFTSD